MKKTSSSLIIFIFALLLASFQSFAQERRVLSENLYRHVRMQERLKLTHLFRLFPSESQGMQVLSLTVTARGFQGQTQLQLLQNGRVLLGGVFGMQTTQVRMPLPPRVMIDDLVLASRGDLFIDTIMVEVLRPHNSPGPGEITEHIYLRQQLPPYFSLDLARIRPHDNRLVESIGIEAYTRYAPGAPLQLTTRWGEVIGTIRVSRSPYNPKIQLFRALPLRDLIIRSGASTPIELEALEIEFERNYR